MALFVYNLKELLLMITDCLPNPLCSSYSVLTVFHDCAAGTMVYARYTFFTGYLFNEMKFQSH